MAEIATEKKAAALTPKKRLIIALIVVLVLALAGGAYYLKVKSDQEKARQAEALRQSIINSGTFHEGITVQGMDVSGMTLADAAAALVPEEQALTADVGFTLTDGAHTYTFDNSQFDFTYDTAAVLAEAMALGREGDLEALQAELADIAENGRAFTIACTGITAKDAAAFVAQMAAELDTPAVNATFTVKELPIKESTKALDVVNVGLTEEDIAAGLDLRDKRFDFVEGITGTELDQEALVKAIEERTQAQDFGEIAFECKVLEPMLTVEAIKETLVLRSSAFTSYAKGNYGRDTRVHNMTKACGLAYGTVLQPGDVFSCNDTLGPRYESTGWQLAPAVIEGGANTEDQPGGGVCQVSTTMYNAVLAGDYAIVYRQAHSSRLSYVDGGLDATINTGSIDFKWGNNTDAPIYVFTWIDTKEKKVWCEIYGLPFSGDFDEIELLSERMPDIDPTADEFIENASLSAPYWMKKNDAKKGYVYDTYKIYKMEGKEVRREMIGTTTYKMHPNRYYVWPGYVSGTPLLSEYRLTPAQ